MSEAMRPSWIEENLVVGMIAKMGKSRLTDVYLYFSVQSNCFGICVTVLVYSYFCGRCKHRMPPEIPELYLAENWSIDENQCQYSNIKNSVSRNCGTATCRGCCFGTRSSSTPHDSATAGTVRSLFEPLTSCHAIR
jgi:hypothetical protein